MTHPLNQKKDYTDATYNSNYYFPFSGVIKFEIVSELEYPHGFIISTDFRFLLIYNH